ncbi:MAG: hypothetical protein AAB480_00660 [Patescibacteria group bacterium]
MEFFLRTARIPNGNATWPAMGSVMQHFERRVIVDGSRVQVWDRKGGEWELLFERDEFRDQYGPYARR